MIAADGAERKGEIKSSFVDRRTYRRRRLMDISRMLPAFGLLLFVLPLMWLPAPGAEVGATETSRPLSSVLIYVFSTWVFLVSLSVIFGAAVKRWAQHWMDDPKPKPDLDGDLGWDP
ncbi:hypothetical protein GG681_10250 [Epibacterium sp. SM1969]|uniref:Uncharacterized protein n=1 Tax=Tritonibacter aquimaris TaxID=2663379 RepID=A0A844AXC2_9RHOB|nr:hypothetical protein [Tritonibacter aquimaris]